jgi:Phosphotransferase enzyme family
VHEHHAIVPNSARTAILLVEGHLPVVRTDEPKHVATLAALREAYDVRGPLLRVVRYLEDDEELSTTLFEMDAPPEDWTPLKPAGWVALESLRVPEVEPLFADGLEEWLAEQAGAPVPPERAPWARSGWLERATAWVDEVARLTGEPRLVRTWPVSALYGFDTSLGSVFLKACFSIWRHEPAATAHLARRHPGAIPEVVAFDEREGWLLMRELTGRGVHELGPEATQRMLRRFGELQRAWIGRDAELLALGAPHRPLDHLRKTAPEIMHLGDRLAALAIPETLVHGDLHQWNAILQDDRVVVFDWSDIALAHPFLDLAPVLLHAGAGESERERLIEAYLEPWAGIAPDAQLREAAALGEALGCVHQAISYRAIRAAFEPADLWLFAGADEFWLKRAGELAERL